YNFESIGEIEVTETLSCDANCDGEISVADATLILQYCGNKDKYKLSEQGLINADVDGTAGISAVDALVIQQVDAGIYKSEDLPLKK
ncbi:MAG: dockerin type I repeat-containing protein, partial [Ruminococcus sp.]|nr:dockerin type I repeat-containing protein [Ruminococcus sp.]